MVEIGFRLGAGLVFLGVGDVLACVLDAPQQFGLFAPVSSAALEALQAIDPDELTPKQALEALYRMKSLL